MENRPSILTPAIDPALEMSDSDLFWQEHWQKFVWALAAIVLAIIIAGAWAFRSAQVRSAAEAALGAAKDPESWRQVVSDFPGTVAAGNAQLLVAGSLRASGDLAGAAAELEKFTAAQPTHPLAGTAWLTLGEIYQAQGLNDKALSAYRTSSSDYQAAYTAPLAMIAEARLVAAGGQSGEARAILESVGALYPETPGAMVAAGELAAMTPPAAAAPLPATE